MTTEKPIVYLDNAATTFPKPEVVYQAMDNFYRNYGGNAGRGANPLARKASALIEETRSRMEDWLGALEVVFQPSATIALNTLIIGSGMRAGDLVYVSPFEHNSVLRPLEYLRKSIGIRIETLPFELDTYLCRLDEVKSLFRLDPPTMVCMSLVSNVLGLILPVAEIAELAKKETASVVTIVDGAQAAGLELVPPGNVDALVFSSHKSLYGPYGIAGIAFGTDWRPNPFVFGGTGTQSERLEMPEYGPSRFEAGSQNMSAIAGLNASVKWLSAVGRDEINSHERKLTHLLLSGLHKIPDLRVFSGEDTARFRGIVSLCHPSATPQVIESVLGARNIAVRSGLHCAPLTHEFIGTKAFGGTTRLSVGYFNVIQDIELFLDTLQALIKR